MRERTEGRRTILTRSFARLAFTVGCVLLLSDAGNAQVRRAAEHKVKAAYILNILRFVEWPDSAFADDRSPVVLGVFGDDPFSGALEEVLSSESIGSHPIVLRSYPTLAALDTCHALFLGPSATGEVGAILERLERTPTLTIGDIDGFGEKGGGINLFEEGNKIRFEVNIDALRRSDIKASSKLLRLAKIIGTDGSAK